MLHSPVHLGNLLNSLLHVSELDKTQISVLEEFTSPGRINLYLILIK